MLFSSLIILGEKMSDILYDVLSLKLGNLLAQVLKKNMDYMWAQAF